jgi:quercetin dioxygenase-like cupin family protein
LTVPRTRYIRLPFSFDLARLRADLDAIRPDEWIAHHNTAAYDKEWRCVPLRSVRGRSDHIVALDSTEYADTPILTRCPFFRLVMDTFECEKSSVRLMAMGPGTRINLHYDKGTSFERGVARIHVPIVTAPEVLFMVEDEEVHFTAGDTWYLNADCLHGVRNDSQVTRIHLMLDCVVNPWLEHLLAETGFTPDERPRYGDPAINEGNVDDVIARLLDLDTDAGRAQAARLASLRDTRPTT